MRCTVEVHDESKHQNLVQTQLRKSVVDVCTCSTRNHQQIESL